MQVIFLQNTIHAGRRYRAGESAEVDDQVAKKMIEADLAYSEQPIVEALEAQPAAEASVKKAPPKTRTTRKAATT